MRRSLKKIIAQHAEQMQNILEDIGLPVAEDTVSTGARFLKALLEMTEGYEEVPKKYSTTFPNKNGGNIVILRDIAFTSLCAHHALQFTGKASIAYVPDQRIIGLSKLARITDTYAKRFQVQEDLTSDILKSVVETTACHGAYVVVKGEHSCMRCRGVKKHGSEMITTAGHGCLSTVKNREAFSEVLRTL